MTIEPTQAFNVMRHRMLAASMQAATERVVTNAYAETPTPAAGAAATDPATATTGGATDPAGAPAAPRDRAHGVLRLLEAGHFRGVAALRLAAKFGLPVEPSSLSPSGKGRAFEKFLAEQQAGSPPPGAAEEVAPPERAVDSVG